MVRLAIDPGEFTGWADSTGRSGTIEGCDTPEGLLALWCLLTSGIVVWEEVLVERYIGRSGEETPHEVIGVVRAVCALFKVPFRKVSPPPKVLQRAMDGRDRHVRAAQAILARELYDG